MEKQKKPSAPQIPTEPKKAPVKEPKDTKKPMVAKGGQKPTVEEEAPSIGEEAAP